MLGLTTGLVGGFCLLLGAVAVGEPFFEDHRHYIAGGLVAAGVFALVLGRLRARKARASQAAEGEPSPGEPAPAATIHFSPLSYEYLGFVVILMGAVALFMRSSINAPKRILAAVPAVKRVEKPVPPPAPLSTPEPPPVPPAPRLKIQGLFFSVEHPTILIDGQRYGAGDTVQGVDIVEISRRSIQVRYVNSNHVYSLPW
jgi:hypothetical protein